MENDFFPEITITMRCTVCRREQIYNQGQIKAFKKTYFSLIDRIEQDGWKIRQTGAYVSFRCPKCRDKNKRALRYLKENSPPEYIEIVRKPNEMTTEEIEDLAKGGN